MPVITKTTLPKDKLDYLIENNNKLSINKLAKELNVSRWTIVSNRYALGLTKPEEEKKEVKCNGYFNIKEFSKHYKY